MPSMIRCFSRTAAAAIVVSVGLASDASAATFAIDPATRSYIESFATDASGANSRRQEDVVALPATGEPSASDFLVSSTTTYSLTNAAFDFGFDHFRGQAANSTAQTRTAIQFRPDSDVGFLINGGYGFASSTATSFIEITITLAEGPGPGPGSSGAYLYEAAHASNGVVGESFTLGTSGGTIWNIENGSRSGTLLAGQLYSLAIVTTIRASGSNPGFAHATGSVNIAFVPEPSTALLIGVGLAGLAHRRRC